MIQKHKTRKKVAKTRKHAKCVMGLKVDTVECRNLNIPKWNNAESRTIANLDFRHTDFGHSDFGIRTNPN